MKRSWLWASLACAFLWSSCALLSRVGDSCLTKGCPDGEKCLATDDGSIAKCVPIPSPTPCPPPDVPVCKDSLRCACWTLADDNCVWKFVPCVTPTPTPTPTATPTPVPTPTPTPVPTPTPPSECRTKCPAGVATCLERLQQDARYGHGTPVCAADGTGPKRMLVPAGPVVEGLPINLTTFECPQGQRIRFLYNDPGGVASRRQYLDMSCNLVTASGAVIQPGFFGDLVCDPKVIPCPSPSPTQPPGATDPRVLVRMGAATHGCQAKKEGQTKIFVNTTPRVPAFPGDTRGQEQPREFNDPHGPDCTQAGPGWSGFDLMEHSSGEAYMCISVLPPGTYTFRACPWPGVPVVDPGLPTLCGETVVRINSHGNVDCLSGCAPYFHNGECR